MNYIIFSITSATAHILDYERICGLKVLLCPPSFASFCDSTCLKNAENCSVLQELKIFETKFNASEESVINSAKVAVDKEILVPLTESVSLGISLFEVIYI